MCAVSNLVGPWTNPNDQQFMPWTRNYPDPALASQMLEIIKRLDAIDKRLGLMDCKLDAATKKKFVRKLQRRAKKK